jgi:hypothetical protein
VQASRFRALSSTTRRFLLLVLLVCALLVAWSAEAGATETSDNYVCVYRKASVDIYIALAVSPRVYGQAFCAAMNAGFKGQRVSNGLPGKRYCAYGRTFNFASTVAAVYSPEARIGRLFCAIWRMPGWQKLA